MAFREQDVVGFDVAVHDAVTVCVVQRLGYFAGEPDGVLDRQLHFALQPVAQALALDVGHRVPEPACCLARVEHGQNVRMLEPGRGLDLAQEALRAEHRAEFGVEHLERDGPLVPDVASEVHGRHAAAPELALELVAVAEGLREVWRWYGHWHEREGASNLAAGHVFRQPQRGSTRCPQHTRPVSGSGPTGDRRAGVQAPSKPHMAPSQGYRRGSDCSRDSKYLMVWKQVRSCGM